MEETSEKLKNRTQMTQIERINTDLICENQSNQCHLRLCREDKEDDVL